MHVLFITRGYPNSYNLQSHSFFQDQANAITKYGNDVGVISPVGISFKSIMKDKKVDFGYKYSNFKDVNSIIYQFPTLPNAVYINDLARNKLIKKLFLKYIKQYQKPDIIHVHVSFVGLSATWIKEKYHIPYVVTEHYSTFLTGNIPLSRRNISKEVFKNSNINIAVSTFLAHKLEHLFSEEFRVIPNLIDTNFFRPSKTKVRPSSTKYFINIGNLNKGKNQSMLIEAFSQGFKDTLNYKLIIVGSGPERERLDSKISNLQMQNQIKLYGKANREQVRNLLQKSDYFVLSSKFETFGVVLIEAMACGLPIVSTKCGGPQSIITNPKLGLLCDIDSDSLKDSIIKISEDSFDRDYIRSFAVQNYSGEVVAKQLNDIYESKTNS